MLCELSDAGDTYWIPRAPRCLRKSNLCYPVARYRPLIVYFKLLVRTTACLPRKGSYLEAKRHTNATIGVNVFPWQD